MTPASQPIRHLSIILLALSAVVVLFACGGKAPEVPESTTVSTEDSGLKSDASENPCSLLEPAEVEGVLKDNLVGKPYRFSKTGKEGPAPDGDACRYETAGSHVVEIEIQWTSGAQTMKSYGTVQNLADQKMKGVLKLGDGSELTGEWDEAKVLNCCMFIAMRGDQLVTVDVSGSNATLEQAAAIADIALNRIDKPLHVASSEGVAAAIARDAARPKERDPCSLISRTEAEVALEAPLARDPVVDGTKCVYTYVGKFPWTIGLTVSWRNGYAQFRQHTANVKNVGKVFSLDADAAGVQSDSTAAEPALIGPWEAAQTGPFEFYAVKKDVLVTADARGAMRQEHAQKLVAAVMSKL